jgi:GNAT superfamily N-acetyltransferase
MEVVIKELNLKDKEKIYPLYAEAFGEKKLEIWKKRWNWEFINSPRTDISPSRMWIAQNSTGRILGFIASFPMLLKVGNREILTSSSGDLLVSKEGRGKGIAQLLVKKYIESADILATDGFGYQPITGHIYRKLGFKPVEIEPVNVRPIELTDILRFLITSGRSPNIYLNRVLTGILLGASQVANLSLSILNRILIPPKTEDISICEAKNVGPEFDSLWNEISYAFPVCCVRDSKFVKWRFIEDPVNRHTLILAWEQNRKLLGYLAFCFSRKDNMLVGNIMDIFCHPASKVVIDQLMCSALEKMVKGGAAIISCMGVHPLIRTRLTKYLYLRAKNSEIPSLLYCKDEQIKKWVYNKNLWHVTKADGDEGFDP